MSPKTMSRSLRRVLPQLSGFNAFEFIHRCAAVALILVGTFAVAVAPASAQTSAPTVSIQGSARVVVHPGDSFTLTAAASGTGSVAYRWYHDNRLIAGETGATLSRASAAMADAGAYTVMATDSVGSQLSEPAFLLVGSGHTRGLLWSNNVFFQRVMIPQWRDVVAVAQDYVNTAVVNADGSVSGSGAGPQAASLASMNDAISVSAGGDFVIVLKSDGTVYGLGSDVSSAAKVPAGLSNVVAISAGVIHALALKSDGTVVAWGDDSYGQTDVPAGLANVVAVSAGGTFSLALKADGTVVGWGNHYPNGPISIAIYSGGLPGILPGDEIGLDPTPIFPPASVIGSVKVPASLSHVVAISAGQGESLALLDDGTVYEWDATTGTGGGVKSGLSNVVAVSASDYRSLALESDGTAMVWGHDVTDPAPASINVSKVVAISAMADSYVAVRDASNDALPSIIAQPQPVTVAAGDEAILSVSVPNAQGHFYFDGVPPVDIQWYRNGVVVAGGTGATLDFANAAESAAGTYTVVVSTATGTVTSNPVTLMVQPVNHIMALSTLCHVGQGDAVAIHSFVLKKSTIVLLRVVGPTLANFGVSNVLQHPSLQLFDGTGKPVFVSGSTTSTLPVAGGWPLSDVTQAVHAFPLSSPDDYAMVINLPAGVYSVQVGSTDGGSGNALVEVYDYREPGDTVAGDRIIAGATRCQVGPASNAVFGLSLNKGATMLIRAVGPSLGAFGVASPLTKPKLTLMDANGNVVATNSGWLLGTSGVQTLNIESAASQVGEFPLTSANDAAVLVTLPAGQFTARVESADGSAGTVLTEAYEISPAK